LGKNIRNFDQILAKKFNQDKLEGRSATVPVFGFGLTYVGDREVGFLFKLKYVPGEAG
jgi:hypothetical protein